MRNFIYALLALILAPALHAQTGTRGGESARQIRTSVLVYRIDQGTGIPVFFPEHDVIGTIRFKDAAGNVLSEGPLLTKTTKASTMDFVFDDVPIDWSQVTHLGYEIEVLDPNTAQSVFAQSGMLPIGSAPRTNFSYRAQSAEVFAGNSYDPIPMTVPELISQSPTKRRDLLAQSTELPAGTQAFRPIDLSQFIRTGTSQSAVTGNPLNVTSIGADDPRPLVFGGDVPKTLEFYYFLFAPELLDFNAAFGFVIDEGDDHNFQDGAHRSVSHQTSAVYAENVHSPQGIGFFASGALRGGQHLGRSGALGRTNGTGNGAGVWGIVAANPPSGGVGYAVLGDSQNRPGSWAGAFFGNSFHTGTWTMMSDAGLKTDVRLARGALDKILRLRPAQYQYLQDTPYRLPDGIHHGFIAQEMETVLPELVTDIRMPVSLDPDTGFDQGTVEYKGVNYVEMIALLTAAIQEMNVKVDAAIQVQKELMQK
jgi:hypothetical protein